MLALTVVLTATYAQVQLNVHHAAVDSVLLQAVLVSHVMLTTV